MTIRLHSVAGSRSFRVLWLLHEIGLHCEVVPYSITDGSLRRDEVLRLAPAGRVPALEIDGRVLFESGAAVEYLCETRPEAGLAPRPDEDERADFLNLVHYAETLAQSIASLNLQHIFLRDPAQASELVMKLDRKRLAFALRPLEARLEGRDYLLKRGFSAADTMMGFTLDAAAHYVRLDDLPNLAAYLARISARPAYRAAQAQEGPARIYDRDFYDPPAPKG